MTRAPGTRNVSLDGLRGIAALAVLTSNFAACFVPSLIPAYSKNLPGWVDTPFGLVINGSFAVAIFFVLSGYVLSAASTKTTAPLAETIGWRWVRLAVPATASILISWSLLQVVPNAMALIEPHIKSPWHEFIYQNNVPSIGRALGEGLFWIFVKMPLPGSFNNVLWTMQIEFLGSIGIYVFYRLIAQRLRLTTLAGVAIALILARPSRPYLGFVFGAALFEIGRAGIKPPAWGPGVLLGIGVLLAFPSDGFLLRWNLGPLPGPFRIGEFGSIIPFIAAFIIVFAVLHSPVISRPLGGLIPSFLGKISFPLYLLHAPLIYTLVAAGVGKFNLYETQQLAGVFVVFVACTFALAWLFETVLDAPLLRLIALAKRRRASRMLRPEARLS